MPLAIQAGLWGLLSGSALILGALIAYVARVGGVQMLVIPGRGGGKAEVEERAARICGLPVSTPEFERRYRSWFCDPPNGFSCELLLFR